MAWSRPALRTAGKRMTYGTKQHQELKARDGIMGPWNNSSSMQSPVYTKIRIVRRRDDHPGLGRARLPNMMTLYGALTLELPQHTPRLSGLVGEGA